MTIDVKEVSEKIEEFCTNHKNTITIGCTLVSTIVTVAFKVKPPKINLAMDIKDLPIK